MFRVRILSENDSQPKQKMQDDIHSKTVYSGLIVYYMAETCPTLHPRYEFGAFFPVEISSDVRFSHI